MCFYIQYQFACGDFESNLRRRCNRVYQRDNSCGAKIASETFHLQSKCSLCSKIAIHRHGQQQEWDRIESLESKEQVNDEAVQRSIGVINQLQSMILALELKRRDQRATVSEDDAELHGSASLGPAVESAHLLRPKFASTVTNLNSSAPHDKLQDGHEEGGFSPRASPSTARPIDVRKAQSWPKDNETPLAKASQGKFAMNVIDILEHWFRENSAHPYPSPDEEMQLCSSTGLSAAQVRMICLPCR